MDSSEVLYGQLRQMYFKADTRAAAGWDRFRKMTSGKNAKGGEKRLSQLLRHHSESSIGEQDTYRRDEFDYLLAFYSMVEVGCVCGAFSGGLPDDHRFEAVEFLAHPAVEHYYRENYPLLLPELHLARLRGDWRLVTAGSEASEDALLSYVEICRTIEFDEDIETFLWFLDDGERDDADFDDLRAVLASPQRTLELLAPKSDTALSSALAGTVKFLSILGPLDRLMGGIDDELLVQSAMWSHLSHWLELFEQRLGIQITNAVGALTAVAPDAFLDDAEDDRRRSGAGAEILSSIARLTSGRYAWPLKEYAAWMRWDLPPVPYAGGSARRVVLTELGMSRTDLEPHGRAGATSSAEQFQAFETESGFLEEEY